jgi:IS605 OrfB family transposase
MVYGEYQAGLLPRLKGQVDLVSRAGTFFLYATIELPDGAPIEPTHFLGVDLGITHLATDSDGTSYTGNAVEVVRQRCMTHRQTFQRTGTTRAKRRLKAMSGQQAKFQRWVNLWERFALDSHGIAKKLVQLAQDTKAALVLEDLTHIRDRMTVRKRQRAKQHNWSFGQLRAFISYKAQRAGVPVVFVGPRNSSKTCARCGHVDARNRRSQSLFSCIRCGFQCHADLNAARNLAVRGAVSRPDLVAPRAGQLAFAW